MNTAIINILFNVFKLYNLEWIFFIVSAHKVVIGLTIANLPLAIANHVVVVPRGSTPGVAVV